MTTTTETFGDLLKYLRKRARLSQRDLAAAVGYTDAHLSRLENNERLPDLATVAALFVPALDLREDPASMERLLKLAANARGERPPAGIRINQVTIEQFSEHELGALEDIPTPPAQFVERPALLEQARASLQTERAIALCGMAGMGKSSLAASLARTFARGPVFWHTLTDGLTVSAEVIMRQLALFLIAQGQMQVKPLVEPRADSAPMAMEQQLILVRAALANLAALLCFEDVHLLRGNDASLSLLQNLIVSTNASFVLTSRENVSLPIAQINIGGLESTEARQLTKQLGLKLKPAALDRLIVRANGNPMLLRLAAPPLLELKGETEGFLERLESQPQVASYLLNAMLRDLSPDGQWLASFISVFRQPADLHEETLAEAMQKFAPLDHLNDAVAELQRRYLIENSRHALLHPLVRDYLYASLAADAPLRKRLHRLAAQWLEAKGELVEAAFHWTRAGELEQASEVICDQSDALFQRGQAKAAVEVVEETLERASRKRGDTSNLRRRLLTARGDLLRGTFRAAEAESSYREALSLAQGQPTVRAGIARSLVYILLQRGQTAEALRLCQSARAELPKDEIVLRARLASNEARALLVLSQYDEAERVAKEAISLADQFAEALPQTADDVWARSERTLGWINYTRHPEGDESLAHYRRALECARRAGLRVIEAATLSNTATALMERGDTKGALQFYEEARQGYERLGDMYGAAGILHNLGVLLSKNEDYDSAMSRFEQASEIERRIGDWEGLLSSEGARASTLIALGRVDDARVILDAALLEGRESTDVWAKGTCLCLLSEAQLLQGDAKSANGSARQVLAMQGIEDNARIRCWAQSDLALIQISLGDFESARSTMSVPPPEDLGFELTTRWQLVQSAVSLACGDIKTGAYHASDVLASARQKNLKNLAIAAEGLLAASDHSPINLARIILTG